MVAPQVTRRPAVGETFDAVVPSGGADMFEDHVDAVVTGEAADFLGDGHDAVMDDFVGANLFGFGEFFVVAGGGDDASAEEFGDLNGGAANAAAGGKNEHGFAGLELRASDEHVPGGLEDERNGGGVSPIEIFGIREAIHIRATHVFGAAAVDHVTEIGVIAAGVVVAGEAGGTLATGDAGSENDFLADVDSHGLRGQFWRLRRRYRCRECGGAEWERRASRGGPRGRDD